MFTTRSIFSSSTRVVVAADLAAAVLAPVPGSDGSLAAMTLAAAGAGRTKLPTGSADGTSGGATTAASCARGGGSGMGSLSTGLATLGGRPAELGGVISSISSSQSPVTNSKTSSTLRARLHGAQRAGPADIRMVGLQLGQRRQPVELGDQIELAELAQLADDVERLVGLLQHVRLRPERDRVGADACRLGLVELHGYGRELDAFEVGIGGGASSPAASTLRLCLPSMICASAMRHSLP